MRFFIVIMLLLAGGLAAEPAQAQTSTGAGGRSRPDATRTVAPPTLDDLFDKLKSARTPGIARRHAADIEAMLLQSGSDTVDLLMARAAEAVARQDAADALDLLDAVIALKPDYAMALFQRATVHFNTRNAEKAMADLDAVLRLEPRHWGALVGLAAILDDYQLKPAALKALRRAAEIYPYLPDLDKKIEALTLAVDGRPT